MSARFLVVDDHLIVLDGLRRLVETQSDWHVIATCTSARKALEILAEEPVDVILLDLKMPDMSGLEFVHHALSRHPQLMIIVLTADINDEELAEALRDGVRGIVLKEEAPLVLLDCIRDVLAGAIAVMEDGLKLALARANKRKSERNAILRVLTAREAEVARIAALGLRSKEIGEALGISTGTVKLHLHSIYNKLEIATRVELANLSRELGLGNTDRSA